MAHPFTPNIDKEVERASLAVLDVLQVDFGNGIVRRWSNRDIPSELSVQLEGDYTARIVSLGSRRWSLGADDDSVSVVLGNADDAISDMARYYGIDVFEGARVRHHRLFPSIGEVYRDYWVGKGASISFEAEVANWDVRFGLSSLHQRALRRFQRTCPHVFAGGINSDCPYDPEKGIGVPKPELFGTAGPGTTPTKLRDTAAGAFRYASPGFLAYNRTRNCVSRVLEVVSENELRLTQPVAGTTSGSAATWQSTDSYAIGPPYLTCEQSPQSCDARGMYGTNNRNPVGLMDGRKYHGGHNDIANVSFRGRTAKEGDRFERKTMGNESYDGDVIPVIFGQLKVYDIDSLSHANADEFQHGLFVLCEGQVVTIDEPLVNERQPDDHSDRDVEKFRREFDVADKAAGIAASNSFIKYGVHIAEEDRQRIEEVRGTPKIAEAVARHIRESIGGRMSLAVQGTSRGVIDRYNWASRSGRGVATSNAGTPATNPYLFSDGTGGGISLHGLAAVRIRIEVQSDDDISLSGNFKVHGLMVPLPDGMPNNSEDGGAFNLPRNVEGAEPIKYTSYPNHIQAAYAFLTNNRWGAGLSDEQLALDSFRNESAYCEQLVIGGANSIDTQIAGVVSAIPRELRGQHSAVARVFYLTADQFVYGGSGRQISNPDAVAMGLIGRRITFNAGVPNRQLHTAIIQSVLHFKVDIGGSLGGDGTNYGFDDDALLDTTNPYGSADPAQANFQKGYLIRIDGDYQPLPGERFTISGSATHGLGNNKRFKANGALSDDVTAVEMLESILANCHGIYRVSGGKLEVLIKKELSAREVGSVLSERLFTDRGEKRNIIYNGAVSSIRVWRTPIEDVINELAVEFPDATRDHKVSRLVVFDADAQIRAATKLGERGNRRRVSKTVQLNLTTNIDQAKRVLSLLAREEILQNLYCEFDTSLKGGMKVQPGDIIAVDSNAVVGLINKQILPDDVVFGDAFLFRVLEKQESAAYVITLTCQLHINGIYNDSVRDFGLLTAVNPTIDSKAGIAANVIPHDPVESVFVDQYGVPRSQIRVKVTYPG